jgi:hypothetical protein
MHKMASLYRTLLFYWPTVPFISEFSGRALKKQILPLYSAK